MTQHPHAPRSLESFNHDGVEIARRKRRAPRGLPWGHFALFALTVVAFKVFLASQIGLASYGAKMAQLAEGSRIERVAAFAMTLDPVSELMVSALQRGFR
ncbi:MAG: hypothetical protein AAF748_08590 [Pseudomonadota bacterium]